MKLFDSFSVDEARHFANKKLIPRKYEKVILIALAHFPELKPVAIQFHRHTTHAKPLSAGYAFSAILKSKQQRRFEVIICEEAAYPHVYMLLKVLPPEAQIGAIARELARITILQSYSSFGLLKAKLSNTSSKLQQEKVIDKIVIEHGLSTQLYEYAQYVSTIPALPEEVHKPALLPETILQLHNQKLGL